MTDQSRLDNLTPERRALLERLLREKQQKAAQADPNAIHPRKPDEPRALSYAQQQLWFLDQLTPGSPAYNVPHALRLRAALNVEALRSAFRAVIERHEVLRTLFLPLKGRPLPAVPKAWEVDFQEIDLRAMSSEQQAAELPGRLQTDGARPFDLARDLKLRAVLYRLSDEEHVLLHVSHHIAWDARSKTVFYHDLSQGYEALASGREVSLPALPIQYADFACWQRRYLQDENLNALLGYWTQQLGGAPPYLDVPTDYPRPTFQDLKGAKHPLALDAAILEAARVLSKESGVTLYVALLSAFKAFLYFWTSQGDVSVGSPFAGRHHPETADLIGMFINTQVLRTRLDGDMSYRTLMTRVRETTMGALAHQELPMEKTVEALRPPRDTSRMPLFQVNFRLQDAPAAPLQLAGLEVETLDLVDNATSKFDLALELNSTTQSVGYIEYSTSLFALPTIQRLGEDFKALLARLISQPDAPLKTLRSPGAPTGGAAKRTAFRPTAKR